MFSVSTQPAAGNLAGKSRNPVRFSIAICVICEICGLKLVLALHVENEFVRLFASGHLEITFAFNAGQLAGKRLYTEPYWKLVMA